MKDFDLERLKQELLPAYEGAETGLPDEVFRYVTTVTPMINVDLLIRDTDGRLLMAWRKDHRGDGWHIPGGIIRYKESAAKRIQETAKRELGCAVKHEALPCKLTEIFCAERMRGHFISLLYNCTLPEGYDAGTFNAGKPEDADGYLKWFDRCPEPVVFGQREAYGAYLQGLFA